MLLLRNPILGYIGMACKCVPWHAMAWHAMPWHGVACYTYKNKNKTHIQKHKNGGRRWRRAGISKNNIYNELPFRIASINSRGARMRPPRRASILDLCFLFGSLAAAHNLQKKCKHKHKHLPSAAPPTPCSYRLMPGFTYI